MAMVGILGIACALCPPAHGATALPTLTAPALYTGEYSRENGSCNILLYLGQSRGFVLREDIRSRKGKVTVSETTGKWYQIRRREALQLTNNGGLRLMLNVGSNGNLYMGLPLQDGGQTTVTLHLKNFIADSAALEYTIYGLLRATAQEVFLQDMSSGIEYRVISENILADFLQVYTSAEYTREEQPRLSVRARVIADREILEDGGLSAPALRIKDIRSIPANKAERAENSPEYFLDAVAGRKWQLTHIGPNALQAAYFMDFSQESVKVDGTTSGKLNIFDGRRYLSGSYKLQDKNLALSASTADAPLARLIRDTRSWQLAGEVLELWGENQLLGLLEKVY
jgi:hypothetical protein